MISSYLESKKEGNSDTNLELSTTSEEVSLSNKEFIMILIATSIYALATGISLVFLSVDIIESSLVIVIITFLVCLIGVIVGIKIRDIFKGYAELVGGIILIFIGINIFNEHT